MTEDKYYVDPNWCFENPDEAAAEISRLHKWCDELEAHVERLRKASLDAIPMLSGGDIKAALRDAYDDSPPDSAEKLKAQWQADVLEETLGLNDRGVEQKMLNLRQQAEGVSYEH